MTIGLIPARLSLGSPTTSNVAVGGQISNTGRAWSDTALLSAVSPVLGFASGVAVSTMIGTKGLSFVATIGGWACSSTVRRCEGCNASKLAFFRFFSFRDAN